MNVLVVGSGGREHALCWGIAASPLLEKLYCAPGNGGIAADAECVSLDTANNDAVVRWCRTNKIELVVVGPEVPLVAGLVDALRDAGIPAFGPTAKAAILEGSKAFMKDLCAKYDIPTAAYGRFRDASAAKDYVRKAGTRVVVKADGLAAGKGVRMCETAAEAEAAIDAMLAGEFGAAGTEIVVEEYLTGEEVSYFALVHGEQVLPFGSAQDHKRVGDGDTGPNTGGMGAYSPAPALTPALEAQVLETIIRPTAKAMVREGRPFTGVLFAGLMLTATGPKLLEYNVRFGDPECQVLVPRLKSDLLTVLMAAQQGILNKVDMRWYTDTALCIVMAAKGYPGAYAKSSPIGGLEAAAKLPGVTVFHAGTTKDGATIRANGGRVLGVTALGKDAREAQARAYAAVDAIQWPEGFCRRDIGWRAVLA